MKMIFKHLFMTAALLPVMATTAELWNTETIATGLDNPRSVAVSPDGTVYVAEAGSGGTTPNEDVDSGEAPGLHCSGYTGAITKIEFQNGIPTVSRLTASFPSLSTEADTCDPAPSGIASTGPSGLAVQQDGSIVLAMGMGGPPSNQAIIDEAFGSVYRVVDGALEETLGNIPAYVATQSALNESNPYGIELVPEGILVADSGADSLFLIRNDGTIETVMTFPKLQVAVPELDCENNYTLAPGTMVNASAVTTSVTSGPDGSIYVGFLTGEPYAPGSSSVMKLGLLEEASEPTVYVDNLTEVTGLDFDANGTLYISQLSDASLLDFEYCLGNDLVNGSVIKVDPDGTREVIGQFPYLNDVAVDQTTGAVYVVTGSVLSTAVGGGNVVKLTKPDPNAATSAASRVCPWLFCW